MRSVSSLRREFSTSRRMWYLELPLSLGPSPIGLCTFDVITTSSRFFLRTRASTCSEVPRTLRSSPRP